MKSTLCVLTCVLACATTALAWAQTQPTQGKSLAASAGVFAYPAKGQKPDQQSKDEAECYNWSKTQSGYDPLSPPAPVETAESKGPVADGSRGKGALRGAAGGAIIGAVTGDAGKGAAIGATVGVLAGGRQSRMAQSEQAQATAAEEKAAREELANAFKRGMGVCLEARGYTVK